MNKTTKSKVIATIAKEMGVPAKSITLLESSGDIENLQNDTLLQLDSCKEARESFCFNVTIGKYINKGYKAEVFCFMPNKTKAYWVSGGVKEADAYDNYNKDTF